MHDKVIVVHKSDTLIRNAKFISTLKRAKLFTDAINAKKKLTKT